MLQFFLIGLLSLLHPFYVSVTEVRHNEKNKTLEISCRVFFDDFETALENTYEVKIDILKPTDHSQVDRLIDDYLRKHLQLSVDGKPLTLQYIGYEIDEDAAWCYFEAAEVPQVKRIDIRNDVLFAEHRTQTNMIHVLADGKRKSTKLDNPQRSFSFTF